LSSRFGPQKLTGVTGAGIEKRTWLSGGVAVLGPGVVASDLLGEEGNGPEVGHGEDEKGVESRQRYEKVRRRGCQETRDKDLLL